MFAALKTAITSGVGRQILTVQKHSPVLMFGTGVVGFVATAVLASRATLKVHDVLEVAEKDRQTADDVLARNTAEYDLKDHAKDLKKIKIKAAIEIVKLYAPAAGVGLIALGALTGSHVVLTRRNVGLTAAYATIERAYQEYRERVRDVVGEEKERELYHGLEDKEVYTEDENGPTTKFIKTTSAGGSRSPYAVLFGPKNANWKPSMDMNLFTLENVQSFATNQLVNRGHLFLNEVHDLLDLPRTAEGQVVGWVINDGSDNFVSLGLTNFGGSYLPSDDKGIWLDFNVAGVVHDKLPSNFKKKRQES